MDTSFLQPYLDQWKTRVHQLEAEISFWKSSYASLQLAYQEQIKDMNKSNDEKFDRVMFYFEESRKPQVQQLPPSFDSSSQPVSSIIQEKKSVDLKKKGWIFEFYRR